ncbi:MAG: ribosome maturation factor RimP [Pseudohongiellaceae bacterium]
MKTSDRKIFALLEPTVAALGLELWGIERISQGRRSLLRIYIDRDAGIGIEDCERVSRQVSGILDVEDPIAGEYTLEVSSPGMNRRLFSPAQFEKYVGNEVSIRMQSLMDGRRNFKGQIKKVANGNVVIEQEDEEVSLPLNEIEKAHIVSVAGGSD